MSTEIPCQTCMGSINDLTGITQLKRIEAMISDNYTMVFVTLVLLIFLGFMLWYFISQIKDTLKKYYRAVRKRNSNVVSKSSSFGRANDDSEDYNDEPSHIESSTHFEPGKLNFVKKIKATYGEYNKEKGEYIRKEYPDNGDDIIDSSILYKKHDEYKYKKGDDDE